MLISERGVPSSFRTLRLKSSPIFSEMLENASVRVEADISTFFSPPPWFSTEGIVNVRLASLFHHS